MELVLGDITKAEVDAIVVPASPDLKEMEGISKAVFASCDSTRLKKVLKAIGHCPIGYAVVTPSFGLKARFIVHTAGAGWYSGRMNEKDVFRDCYRHSLQKAHSYGAKSIAIPLMFSGSMHIPRADALKIVKSTVEEFERVTPGMKIYLVLWKESIYNLARHIMAIS